MCALRVNASTMAIIKYYNKFDWCYSVYTHTHTDGIRVMIMIVLKFDIGFSESITKHETTPLT